MKFKKLRWFVAFLISVGLAILGASLLASQSALNYSTGYSANLISSTERSTVKLPENYREAFFLYVMVDCPNSQIIRKMYVDRKSLSAIATTQKVPDNTTIVMETHSARFQSGRLVPVQLSNVFIREKQPGSNADADNGRWLSGWYSPSGSLVSDNQSSCIACHRMVRDRDYLFTLPALLEAARTERSQQQHTEFGTSVCR